jgi:hypothetical protein
MAKFELKFISMSDDESFIKAEVDCNGMEDFINISGENAGESFYISLDKSTAIKFAKTLRTEINKITESEVKNG